MTDKATSIREDLEKEGYSREEEYFHRMNQELIQKRRKELDEKRDEQKARGAQSIHWLKCPKCGSEMKEIGFYGIVADQCAGCSGIYFDHGEFEALLESKMPKKFLKALLKKLRAKLSEFNTTWKP